MAGRGPAPGANPNSKPADQRRKPNREAGLAPLPADGYTGKYPELPKTYRHQRWDAEAQEHKSTRHPFLAETRRWYKTWATSPLAHEFTEVHWLRLQEIAKLKDRLERGDFTVAGEYRHALAGFGGTPFDLRRLGKRVTRTPEPAGPVGNVRRLRAVDPNAVARR